MLFECRANVSMEFVNHDVVLNHNASSYGVVMGSIAVFSTIGSFRDGGGHAPDDGCFGFFESGDEFDKVFAVLGCFGDLFAIEV